MLVSKDEEAAVFRCTQSSEALVDALVPCLYLVQDYAEHDNIIHRTMLQNVDLRPPRNQSAWG